MLNYWPNVPKNLDLEMKKIQFLYAISINQVIEICLSKTDFSMEQEKSTLKNITYASAILVISYKSV